MAKVTNKTARGIFLRSWRILPNSSKIVDRMGNIHETMPDIDAYCAKGKQLANEGVLELEGYTPKKVWKVKVADKVAVSDNVEIKEKDASKEPTVETVPEKKSKKKHSKK